MTELVLEPPFTSPDEAPDRVAFTGQVDHTYDEEFVRMKLRWLPWVGRNFRASAHRTIILGESLYAYKGLDGLEATRLRIEEPGSLRSRIVSHGIEGRHRSTFVRNFERAIFLTRDPSREARESLWAGVIFHNLAPDLLDDRAKRPSDDQYARGWKQLLELAVLTGATRCIVYGTEKRKLHSLRRMLPAPQVLNRRSLPVVGRIRPMTVSLKLPVQQLDLLFIGHPSAYFSWKKWGALLHAHGLCPAMAALPICVPDAGAH